MIPPGGLVDVLGEGGLRTLVDRNGEPGEEGAVAERSALSH
jgi:hypothetical protein